MSHSKQIIQKYKMKSILMKLIISILYIYIPLNVLHLIVKSAKDDINIDSDGCLV